MGGAKRKNNIVDIKQLLTIIHCALLIVICLFIGGKSWGQQTITLNGNISQIIDFGTIYNFYDSGGANGNYSVSENYTATFTSTGNIYIDFSSFTTENSYYQGDYHDYDNIKIYDGDASTGTKLVFGATGWNAGSTNIAEGFQNILATGTTYIATSGTMTIVWKSDGADPYAGWKAQVYTNSNPILYLNRSITQSIASGTTYNFYDSGGPCSNYSVNEYYTATFTSTGNIYINFSSFGTESSDGGNNDWDNIKIYDGDASTGTPLVFGATGWTIGSTGIAEGFQNILTTGTTYIATSGTMTVVWKSDGGYADYIGWSATVTADPFLCMSRNIIQEIDCGTTYKFYDSGCASGKYNNGENYFATFTSSGNIYINFSSFGTENCNNNDYDNIKIYDGDASTGTKLVFGATGWTAGSTGAASGFQNILTTGATYIATSGTMTVVWKSNGSTPSVGWEATVKSPVSLTTSTNTICNGGELSLSSCHPSDFYDNDPYIWDWDSNLYGSGNQIANASVKGSVLSFTTTGNDPSINMYDIGSFDPNIFNTFKMRYRITNGSSTQMEVFHTYAGRPTATGEDQKHTGTLISDRQWHICEIDMTENDIWMSNGDILGWRLDPCTANGVTMEIDWVGLFPTPIATGESTISVSPVRNTTYCVCNYADSQLGIYKGEADVVVSSPTITSTPDIASTCFNGSTSVVMTASDLDNGSFTDDFESGLGNWSVTTTDIRWIWRQGTGSGDADGQRAAHGGSYNANIQVNGVREKDSYLRLNKDLSSFTNLRLSFWYCNPKYNNHYDEIYVEYSSDGITYTDSRWNDAYDYSHNDWTQVSNMVIPDGTKYIRFRAVTYNVVGVGLDDVSITYTSPTYDWRGSATGMADGATYTATPTVGSNTYIVTNSITGCSKSISVNTPSVGSLSIDNQEVCIGTPTTLTVVSTSPTASEGFVYEWSNSLGNNAESNSIVAAGSYTVSVTATNIVNEATCTATGVQTGTVSHKTPSSSEISNMGGISNGNLLWTGRSTDWSTANNWMVYNSETGKYTLTTAPGSSNTVVIGKYSDCVTGTPTLNVNETASVGTLKIASGTTVNVNAGQTLNIAGDLDNVGTLSANNTSSKVVFNGSSDQTISNAVEFKDVTFAQTGDGVHKINASNDITVNGTATFTRGIVTGNVTFGTTGLSANASRASYVNGTVTKNGSDTPFTFPTGSDGVLGTITATIGSGSWVSAKYNHNSADNGDGTHGFTTDVIPRWWNAADMCDDADERFDHVSNFEYWDVSSPVELSEVTLVSEAASATEHFNSTSAYVNNDIQVAAYTNGCWKNFEGSAVISGADHNIITITGATIPKDPHRAAADFLITLGSKSKNTVLPIELISFTATCDGRSALVEWTTATERNNDYFSLERSGDAINFTEIARVAGTGNSIEPLDYSYTDYGIHGGDNYYRLVQVDYDGTRTASDIVVANCIESEVSEPEVMAYPNPFSGELTLVLDNFSNRAATIEVYDMLGKQLLFQKADAPQNYYEMILNLSNLPSGAYTVRVSTTDFVINKNVVKN